MRTVRTYIKRAQGNVTRFAFGRSSGSQAAIISYVADRCKGLQELCLDSSLISATLLKAAPNLSNLRFLTLSSTTEITLHTAIEVIICCKNLEHAEFSKVRAKGSLRLPLDEYNFVNLRTLILDQGEYEQDILPMNDIVQGIPNIRSLRLRKWIFVGNHFKLHGFSKLAFLEHLDIGGCSKMGIPHFPSSLHTLLMPGWVGILSISYRPQNLPNLLRLSISDSPDLPLEAGIWLDASKGNILELDLSDTMIDMATLRSWIEGGYFRNLEYLSLRGCSFNDDLSKSLVHHARKIKSLNLSFTQISGVGVKILVQGFTGTLRYLNLASCQSTSLDAVQWARAAGLTVHYEFSEIAGKGRKVWQM